MANGSMDNFQLHLQMSISSFSFFFLKKSMIYYMGCSGRLHTVIT